MVLPSCCLCQFHLSQTTAPVSAVPVGGARVLWSLVWQLDRAAPGLSCSKWCQGPSERLSGWEDRALWWVHWIRLKFWEIRVSEPFIPKPSFSPGHTHTTRPLLVLMPMADLAGWAKLPSPSERPVYKPPTVPAYTVVSSSSPLCQAHILWLCVSAPPSTPAQARSSRFALEGASALM